MSFKKWLCYHYDSVKTIYMRNNREIFAGIVSHSGYEIPQGTAEELESRRRRAMDLLDECWLKKDGKI